MAKQIGLYPAIRFYCSELNDSGEQGLARILNIRNVLAALNRESDTLLEEFISAVVKQGIEKTANQYKDIFDSEHEHFIQSCRFLKK